MSETDSSKIFEELPIEISSWNSLACALLLSNRLYSAYEHDVIHENTQNNDLIPFSATSSAKANIGAICNSLADLLEWWISEREKTQNWMKHIQKMNQSLKKKHIPINSDQLYKIQEPNNGRDMLLLGKSIIEAASNGILNAEKSLLQVQIVKELLINSIHK